MSQSNGIIIRTPQAIQTVLFQWSFDKMNIILDYIYIYMCVYIHSNVSNIIYLHRFKPWRLNTSGAQPL